MKIVMYSDYQNPTWENFYFFSRKQEKLEKSNYIVLLETNVLLTRVLNLLRDIRNCIRHTEMQKCFQIYFIYVDSSPKEFAIF